MPRIDKIRRFLGHSLLDAIASLDLGYESRNLV